MCVDASVCLSCCCLCVFVCVVVCCIWLCCLAGCALCVLNVFCVVMFGVLWCGSAVLWFDLI